MKRKFSSREKVLLVILAVLLVACIYFLAVDQPVNNMLLEASRKKSDLESELLIANTKVIRMRNMQEELDQLSASAEADVPDFDNARNVVKALNDALAGTRYSMTFRAMEFEGAIARRTIDLTFTCGQYTKARSILDALAGGPYRCEITALSMETDPTGGDVRKDDVTTSVTLTFYEFSPTSGESESGEK